MYEQQKPLHWAYQQAEVIQRMRDGGGAAGVARMEQVAQMAGGEILEAMMSGALPYPPMNDTLGIALVEVGHGMAVFQGRPQLQHYNPLGSVHGGWFAALLDSALGCTIHSTLPAGRSYTTAELNIKIVRPATDQTGPLRATGRLIHRGDRIATAEASIQDEGGNLYAHATTTCLMLDMPRRAA